MEIGAVGFGRAIRFLMLGIAEVSLAFLCFGLGQTVLGGWLLIIFAGFVLSLAAAILWRKSSRDRYCLWDDRPLGEMNYFLNRARGIDCLSSWSLCARPLIQCFFSGFRPRIEILLGGPSLG